MILSLSADDSSDKTVPLISAGAVIGFPPDLFEAECKWQQRLDRDDIKYFRAFECQNLVGEFEASKHRWTPNAARTIADAVRGDLVKLFRSSPGLIGLGISMPLADFQSAIAESKLALDYYGSDKTVAIYKRLLNTVVLLLEKDWPESRGFPIACEFDMHSNWRKAEKAYQQLKDSDPLYTARIGHIGHGDDKRIQTLQMADMVAYESRLRTLSWMNGADDLRLVFQKDTDNRSVYYLGIILKDDLLRFQKI